MDIEKVKQVIIETVSKIKLLSPVDLSVNVAASQSIKLRFKHGTVDNSIIEKLKKVCNLLCIFGSMNMSTYSV